MDSSDRPSESEGLDNEGGDDADTAGDAADTESTDADTGRSEREDESLLSTVMESRATTAVGLVVAVTVLGLALRLLLLGDRIAHWDEGRVAYWITYYIETGNFAYRRIIHGPFIQHVNHWLFPILGANDFTMRLPVALISSTLPLSALFFREHLRKAETVGLALFLAINPVILYYSRFMRSDLLVATFMFVALGTLIRFYDTRKWRYLYAAGALMACGFASKENAILYVLTWLGALGLLADQALHRSREHASGYRLLVEHRQPIFRWVAASGGGIAVFFLAGSLGLSTVLAAVLAGTLWALVHLGWIAVAGIDAADPREDPVAALRGALRDRSSVFFAHCLGAVVVFLALTLFFYAPRGAGELGFRYPPMTNDKVMFWQAVADPTQLPALIEHTWNYVSTEWGQWFSQAGEGGDQGFVDQVTEFLGRYVRVMGTKAAPLSILAVAGFVYERYGRETSRNLVMFSAYCGFVSVIGYPIGTDIFGAWIVVHSLLPLAIPAAVGLGVLYQWGHEAFVADDQIGVAAAAVVLLIIAGQVGAVTAGSVYQNPQSDDNNLVQYAQPSDDPRAELNAIRDVAGNDSRAGSDVLLYYGETGDRYNENGALVEKNPSNWNTSYYNYQPLCAKWFNLLPLPWYFASSDAAVDCAREPATVVDSVESEPPAVVISVEGDQTLPAYALEEEYTRATYSMRTSGTRWVYWVHESVEIDRETDRSASAQTPEQPAIGVAAGPTTVP